MVCTGLYLFFYHFSPFFCVFLYSSFSFCFLSSVYLPGHTLTYVEIPISSSTAASVDKKGKQKQKHLQTHTTTTTTTTTSPSTLLDLETGNNNTTPESSSSSSSSSVRRVLVLFGGKCVRCVVSLFSLFSFSFLCLFSVFSLYLFILMRHTGVEWMRAKAVITAIKSFSWIWVSWWVLVYFVLLLIPSMSVCATDTMVWSQQKPRGLLPPPRYYHSATYITHREQHRESKQDKDRMHKASSGSPSSLLCVYGGRGAQVYGDVWLLDCQSACKRGTSLRAAFLTHVSLRFLSFSLLFLFVQN